jgi:hypothetical protein
MRYGKTELALRVMVEEAKAGARIVAISNKQTAARTHAAIKRLGGGTRDGDTWTIGKGSIEVRT